MVTKPFNLMQWIADHDHEFQEPVMNKQFYKEADDVIVFVSKGPNTRNDYHVNETEELFYQLKGDIAVRIRPLDGSDPHDVIIREGEMWLLPRLIPHRPQRPAGTLGLIVEFPASRRNRRQTTVVLQRRSASRSRSRVSTQAYRSGLTPSDGRVLERT